jgi:predicted kinase
MKVIFTVGLPGSGKSTWAKNNAKDLNALIINRDSIRTMIAGSYSKYDFKDEDLVIDITKAILASIISNNRNIILDETNLTRYGRKRWVDTIKDMDPDVEFYYVNFDIPIEGCKVRRRFDNKDCDADWDSIIDKMAKGYQPVNNELEGINKLEESDG